ncbi:MAG: hypothetical protein Q9167_007935 [Letrouitia subvulpina]
MDPLSITASVLTVSEATLGTLKALQIAYGSQKEIESLSKSVSDFIGVLKIIDHASRRPRLSSVAVNDGLLAVRHLLDSAKLKLLDLQDTLDRKFSANQSNIKSSINKIVWVKERKRVKQIIQELQVLKIDILSVWGPLISLDISQVLFTLEKLPVNSSRTAISETLERDSQVDASGLSQINPYFAGNIRARNSRLTTAQQSDRFTGTTFTDDTSGEDLAASFVSSIFMASTNVLADVFNYAIAQRRHL